MDFELSRIRRGEALAGAGAIALLVLMFVLRWYGPRVADAGPASSRSGWQAMPDWRWAALASIAAAGALVFLQATRRAPALPASLSVVATVLGLVSAVWLTVAVLLDYPPHQRAGAILGLLSAWALAGGAYASLREEGVASGDEPAAIPTVRLDELPS